jgi:HD-GYP domain-containing protein (c-di-GMP phosphodiesterase class II)
LAGERIPLPSRILGAADALDAMTTARAYREPLGLEDAIGELVEQGGRQFDRQVANCLVELLEKGDLRTHEERRVVTSYTIGSTNGSLRPDDYQRIRCALFPTGERRRSALPKISVASAL